MKTCDLATHTAPERQPRQPLRQTIGQAIQRACRAALRLGLGLRIPASRIHQYDLQAAGRLLDGELHDGYPEVAK